MIAENMKPLVAGNSLLRAMFEEGNRLKAEYGEEKVFDFSLGNPDAPPAPEIKKAIQELLETEHPKTLHGYMNNAGFEDVRQTVADHINQTHLAEDSPKTHLGAGNIIMTAGAAGGLNVVFKTILNPGDEVLIFTPAFMEYQWYIKNHGGVVVTVPAAAPDFQPDLAALAQSITPKTKALLINSPNNPTGVIYSEETIRSIAAVLKQKQEETGQVIFLVSDEPYRELAYDGIKVPYITRFYDNAIVAYSYSKSFSLPGQRIGYLVIPPQMENSSEVFQAAAIANRTLGFVNAPSLQQKLIKKCIDLKTDLDYYDRNRQALYEGVTELGFSCNKPQGAFYLFMKSPIDDDGAFCAAAKKYNILMVPGKSFAAPGYVRIAYCVSLQTIQNSMESFSKLAKDFF